MRAGRVNRVGLALLIFGVVVFFAGMGVAGAGTFLKSGDHDDELVGKFLTDADYGLMVDGLKRNGTEFDWGWVKTPDGKVKKPKVLGFDLASFKTVRIPAVQDFSGSLSPELAKTVHEAFERAAKELGLTVVAEDAKDADLELGAAIIDVKRESTFAVVAMIDPYIKLEVRLKAVASGENLLLLRNRSHSATPEDASLKLAIEMVKFVR